MQRRPVETGISTCMLVLEVRIQTGCRSGRTEPSEMKIGRHQRSRGRINTRLQYAIGVSARAIVLSESRWLSAQNVVPRR
jgi:hypothetical protein